MTLQGNAIVGQSGGCTAVINCSLAGVINAVKQHSCIGTLYGMWNGVIGLLNEDFTNLLKQDKDTIVRLYNTPSSALGSCRYKLNDEDTKKSLKILQKYNIRYVFLIGGNDTADTSMKLYRAAEAANYDMRVIAIPKTIDNDLPVTDHCPGFGSVGRFIAQSTQEAGKDTESMKLVDPFKVIEVMGRNSGWMVASAALGKTREEDAPHLLYFPERAFNMDQFITDVRDVYYKFGYVVVVVSETIRDEHGRRVGNKSEGVTQDHFGHGYVEGTARTLCDVIEKTFNRRARYDKPGTIQRMSMPYISSVDQKEAFSCGEYAVEIAVEGKSGVMVIMERVSDEPYTIEYSEVEIDEIAGKEKYMPKEFINDAGNFVTDAFYEYARPLIGSPLPQFAQIADVKS